MPKPTQCPNECQRKRWVFRFLVLAQFALVIALMIASRPRCPSWLTWSVSTSGVAIGLWAIFTMRSHLNISPELRKNAPLRTNGPYRFVRHPMYLALLVFCGGYLIESFSIYSAFLWLALLFVLVCKMHYEEQILRNEFSEYQQYSETTKKIIPFIF